MISKRLLIVFNQEFLGVSLSIFSLTCQLDTNTEFYQTTNKMRLSFFRLTALLAFVNVYTIHLAAQGFSFNCARDTLVPGCPAGACITLKTLIPDPQRAASTYAVNDPVIFPSCLLAANDPALPGTATGLNIDDTYSSTIPIGFPFIFFGTTYNDLKVSSNGYITFNTALTGFSHYGILNSGGFLSASAGTPENLPSTLYAQSIIMGPYHDIDVGVSATPPGRIEYIGSGISPYRTWTINYYRIPLFSAACNALRENTHQIVLYESTGIIDVNIFDKQICLGWNQGRSMVGVQNAARNVGVMAPGRKASDNPWGAVGMNEKWRFVPVGGTPLFKRVELYDLAGTLVTTGTSVSLPNGDRDVSFPNICTPAGASTTFVVKAFYEKIDDPATEIFGTDTITINRTQGLVATASFSPASCGSSNGVITVNSINGGVGPYEYSLDGVTWQSSNVFTGLAGGTYTVHVKDSGPSCTADIPVTITISGSLAASTTSTPAACTGINNGTITFTSAGGTGPYIFTLDGGAPQSGTIPYTFTGLTPGSHTVVVAQASDGCASTPQTITITTSTGVTANATQNAATCAGSPTGSITVNATAGTAPFTFELDGGTPQSGTSPYTFTGVTSGAHTVIVRDNAGCNRTINVTVLAGTGVTASSSQIATTCPSATNGSITITTLTGTAPFTFQLDGGAVQSGTSPYTFNNVSAGPHSVFITDNFGCTRTVNINVVAGPALTANALPSATSCNGAANGSITVTPNGGVAPFTFALDGGTPVNGTAPYTFSNLAAGPHTIVVTDAIGCVTNTIDVTINAGPVLTTTATHSDVLCNGGNTGSITVSQPIAGAAPYEYSLDGTTWQSSNLFSGLTAGLYTVYFREVNGCQNSITVTVAEPLVLSTTPSTVAVVCNGESNGIITMTSSGGVLPYEYSLDGINWQSSNIFNVVAGSYNVTIRDANGCMSTQPVTVTEPLVLTAFSANTNATCDGGNDGIIDVTATGGNSSYSYSIDGINFQPSNIFNVAPGTYTITVKDNFGCSTSFTTTVGLTNNLSLTPQVDPVICESKSVQLELVSNATLYSWTPSTALTSTTIANPIANPVVTTQYIVSATLGRCSANDTVIVNVNAAPIPDAGPDGYICYGQTYQLQANGGVQYAWTPSTFLNNTNTANPIADPAHDITYTVTILADANGCASLTTDDIYIDVTAPIEVQTFPYDTIGYPGDQFQLLAVPSDNEVINYLWTPQVGLENPTIGISSLNIPNPIVTIGALGDDVLYKVTASTVAGCKGEGYVRVRAYKGPDIYVPTGFTPNGDGKNDRFIPFPVGMKSYNYFRVFNRWGQMVFSTTRLNEGWDGQFGGKHQPGGVYVWMIEGLTKDNRLITKKGTVTLIR